MEEIRTYRFEEDEQRRDEEQRDFTAAPEDELPFEIPRD